MGGKREKGPGPLNRQEVTPAGGGPTAVAAASLVGAVIAVGAQTPGVRELESFPPQPTRERDGGWAAATLLSLTLAAVYLQVVPRGSQPSVASRVPEQCLLPASATAAVV